MKTGSRPISNLLIAACTLLLCACGETGQARTAPGITLVIHGGAGTMSRKEITPERERQYREILSRVLESGFAILEEGGGSLDAVEHAIRIMEDSPLFNAGKGAVFTNEGKNEMDALIMSGAERNAGAVASVTTIKNPIRAARAVLEHSQHVLLAGRGAEKFAAEQGLEIVDPAYFFTQRRWDALQKAKEKSSTNPRKDDWKKFGTVGALALDARGNLAAGTSTGGLTNKLYGRVGDSPIIGAGTYANNDTCAVSGTGQGEYFMRNLVGYDVSALMEYAGLPLAEAARKVIHEKLTGLGGRGGIIAMDKDGHIAMPFNTEGMYRGYISTHGEPHVFIYGDE
ncbi:MAG: isoaspartyl peptidase/L-asparaginase [Acidobacteria bacterium]|nr:isoaspartyl peptidase/L-asparaginase [Acidobacteriota bacterium]